MHLIQYGHTTWLGQTALIPDNQRESNLHAGPKPDSFIILRRSSAKANRVHSISCRHVIVIRSQLWHVSACNAGCDCTSEFGNSAQSRSHMKLALLWRYMERLSCTQATSCRSISKFIWAVSMLDCRGCCRSVLQMLISCLAHSGVAASVLDTLSWCCA